MIHRGRPLVAVLGLLLLGADECPLTTNPPSPGTSSSTSSVIDVGGSGGALWQLLFAEEVTLTLRLGDRVAAKKAANAARPVELLGSSIELSTLCWRSDTICPHQVLPSQTLLLQPSSAPGKVIAGFNRRGPLASLNDAVGLLGQLDGKELSIPLVAGEGYCALGRTSIILATAHAAEGAGDRADSLEGRVTVAYSGSCLALGGSAALDPAAVLELSMGFAGKRQ